MDPWFRIDTTVVGICVTDAYSAAMYQAPPSANISNMGVKNFAMHVVMTFGMTRSQRNRCQRFFVGILQIHALLFLAKMPNWKINLLDL